MYGTRRKSSAVCVQSVPVAQIGEPLVRVLILAVVVIGYHRGEHVSLDPVGGQG
jgi:hypothetical protein